MTLDATLHLDKRTKTQWCGACRQQLDPQYTGMTCSQCGAAFGALALNTVQRCAYQGCRKLFLDEWTISREYCSAQCNRIGHYPTRVFALANARVARWGTHSAECLCAECLR